MKRILLISMVMVALVGCESDKHSVDTSDYPEPTAFGRQEIVDRIAALEYQTDSQLYENMLRLAYIGEIAVPFLLDGLSSTHVRVRSSCVYILGLMGDRRTIPALKKALTDPNSEVRYEAATALGNMGDRDGYRVLVGGLSDENIKNRYKAHEALTLLTGISFGYHHDDPPDLRRQAVLKWEAWVDRVSEDDR